MWQYNMNILLYLMWQYNMSFVLYEYTDWCNFYLIKAYKLNKCIIIMVNYAGLILIIVNALN